MKENKQSFTLLLSDCFEEPKGNNSARRRKKKHISIGTQDTKEIKAETLPHISFYKSFPHVEINFSELEEICESRLELYEILLEANENFTCFSEEWRQFVLQSLFRLKSFFHLLLDYSLDENNICEVKLKDEISHFMLRFAFCIDGKRMRTFIDYETKWFLFRFIKLKRNEKSNFLQWHFPELVPISNSEKEFLKHELDCLVTDKNIEDVNIFKVPFENVPLLLCTHKAYLLKGMVYFREIDIVFYVQTYFRRQLTEVLNNLRACWKENKNCDLRLENLLEKINYKPIVKKIQCVSKIQDDLLETTFDELDEVSKNYPLCMKNIHKHLLKEHHLRYTARMHYGVFLVSIGVQYEEAMEFWKFEFTKKFSSSTFRKKYEYLFKHQYAKVGSKKGYNPYSCNDILTLAVGPLDNHGCPFKLWHLEKLSRVLDQDHIEHRDKMDIINLVQSKLYSKACTKYFNATNNGVLTEIITHPHLYFQESYFDQK